MLNAPPPEVRKRRLSNPTEEDIAADGETFMSAMGTLTGAS